MNTRLFSQTLRFLPLPAYVLAASTLSMPSMAADTTDISGSINLSLIKQEALPVSPQGGDMLLLEEAHGANRNTGTADFMDGAQMVNKGVASLLRGSGPQHGYITFAKDGNQVDTKWSGTVTTTQSKDGQQMVSFKGTWEQVRGTGKYQGIQGHGTYTGHYISPKDYVVDWEGQSTLPVASR